MQEIFDNYKYLSDRWGKIQKLYKFIFYCDNSDLLSVELICFLHNEQLEQVIK